MAVPLKLWGGGDRYADSKVANRQGLTPGREGTGSATPREGPRNASNPTGQSIRSRGGREPERGAREIAGANVLQAI